MTFIVFFSIFVAALLVFCSVEFKKQEFHETLLSYRVECASFAVMIVGFVGSLLTSIVQSASGG